MINRVFQFLYPRQCLVCRAPVVDVMLCNHCYIEAERYYQYCDRCGSDLLPGLHCISCNDEENCLIDRYIFAYQYSYAMREAIIQLKFNHKMHMVRVIKELMQSVLEEHSHLWDEIDYIVSMPVDRVRLAGRGFNHMLEIALCLQEYIGKPVVHDVLYKKAFSIPQSNLSKKERSYNLVDAFECKMTQGNILLLDDVMTTGKTLQFAAKVLKKAGAQSITSLILAKA